MGVQDDVGLMNEKRKKNTTYELSSPSEPGIDRELPR
jgi:hypothetical protein